MNIDFTQGMDYWTALIKAFIDLITDFFGDLGIKIFTDSEVKGDE
jgi:hypothetical protein